MMRASLLVLSLSLVSSSLVSLENRPVSKVVNILKEMVEQLEKEAKEDEDVYQQMGCWCTTNEDEKTQAIANGESSINELTAKIEELTANSARLNTEIPNLGKEVANNEEAMDSATTLRKKQLAEFNAEEKDMLQTLTSLKGAVTALSKHHEAAAFLQTSETLHEMEVASMMASLQSMLHRHEHILAEKFTPKQLKVVSLFAASPDIALLQTNAPASGEIFGILKAMKEEFETNLASSQKEEKENLNGYEELKAAKTDEIAAGQEMINTKSEELADTDEKNEQAKQDLENTRATLEADTKFLAELKETCRNADQEYEERSKTRQMEIGAVSKALSFLNSDEAHALFAKSLSFLQMSSQLQERRAAASKVLRAAAEVSQDPRLAVLAVKAGPCGFGEIKKTIQEMVDDLMKQKEDEIKLKDFCRDELNSNERDTTSKTRDKQDTEAKIADLAQRIDQLTEEIEALKAAIAEAALELKHAGENREKANAEFQSVIADQRATQKLLTAALDILKGFYEKSALTQVSANAAEEQPKFKKFEKNKKSGGVMGMMQGIIDDAKAMEDEATHDEEKGQTAYEAFVVDTNESLDAMRKSMGDKSDAKAKAEGDKVERETELEGLEGELTNLAAQSSDLHKQCDYTMKNFDARQSTRDDEVAALKQAIGIFSGR